MTRWTLTSLPGGLEWLRHGSENGFRLCLESSAKATRWFASYPESTRKAERNDDNQSRMISPPVFQTKNL